MATTFSQYLKWLALILHPLYGISRLPYTGQKGHFYIENYNFSDTFLSSLSRYYKTIQFQPICSTIDRDSCGSGMQRGIPMHPVYYLGGTAVRSQGAGQTGYSASSTQSTSSNGSRPTPTYIVTVYSRRTNDRQVTGTYRFIERRSTCRARLVIIALT